MIESFLFLTLAGSALLVSIALFWSSIHHLVSTSDEVISTAKTGDILLSADDRKRMLLRAIKDLELEQSIGRIDADDYRELSERYRSDAMTVIREIDHEIDPYRAQAEQLVQDFQRRQK